MQMTCKKSELDGIHEDRSKIICAAPVAPPMKKFSEAPANKIRRPWVRRVHAVLGLISALNLFVLIGTGFLLQHRTLLRLDERTWKRGLLPSGYRPQDGESGVRADIVIADLHSGRLFGVVGALALDVITLAWLVMLATGLVMYLSSQRANGRAPNRGANQEFPGEDN